MRMNDFPKGEVLGVYYVPGLDKELREALRMAAVSNNVEWDRIGRWTAYVDRAIPRVMFDILVDAPEGGFNVNDFVQHVPTPPGGFPRPVAHDEALLSPDGCRLLDRRRGCTTGLQSGRVAFYMYGYDPELALHWTYGAIECPAVSLISAHLWSIVPDLAITRGIARQDDWLFSSGSANAKPAIVV